MLPLSIESHLIETLATFLEIECAAVGEVVDWQSPTENISPGESPKGWVRLILSQQRQDSMSRMYQIQLKLKVISSPSPDRFAPDRLAYSWLNFIRTKVMIKASTEGIAMTFEGNPYLVFEGLLLDYAQIVDREIDQSGNVRDTLDWVYQWYDFENTGPSWGRLT